MYGQVPSTLTTESTHKYLKHMVLSPDELLVGEALEVYLEHSAQTACVAETLKFCANYQTDAHEVTQLFAAQYSAVPLGNAVEDGKRPVVGIFG